MAAKKSRNKRNTQSDPTLDDLFAMLGGLSKRALMYIGALIVLLVLGVLLFMFFSRTSSISLDDEGELTLSPTQIKSMENIGEWEFLSISNEEIVDTVRHGFFGDNELVRIYYGTLRLGIDMHETREGWISLQGDTVTAILPPVKLLYNDFIDEARTKPFYENGSWDQKAREALYAQAKRKMKERCLTEDNINIAQLNAVHEIAQVFRSMGYTYVDVHF
jgi:hypothetical protein